MPSWPSGAFFSIWKEAGKRALNLRLIFFLLACGNSKQTPWFINNDCISSLRECKGISRSRLMKLIPSDCIVNVTRVQYVVCYWKMLMLLLAGTGHGFNQTIFVWGLKEMGSSSSSRHNSMSTISWWGPYRLCIHGVCFGGFWGMHPAKGQKEGSKYPWRF